MINVGRYIQDYSLTKLPHSGECDELGVPLFDPKSMGWDGEPCYHPTVVIQHALAVYTRSNYLGMKTFNRCCEWLLSNLNEVEGVGLVWFIPFPIRTPRIQSPWISALTQSQGASLLIRYASQNNLAELKDTIKKILNPISVSLNKGGLLFEGQKTEKFLEEAGDIHILNGCLTSIWGLLEFQKAFQDHTYWKVAEEVKVTVENWLPKYDTGYWSKYSLRLRYNLADLHYHRLHSQQLLEIGYEMNSEIFIDYAKKWHQYSLSPESILKMKRRRWLGVNLMRLFTLFRLERLKFIKI